MGFLKKNERDVGVCATLICPHCQAFSPFMLREVSALLNFYGWPLWDVNRCYQLFCNSCRFRKDIDHSELRPAGLAIQLFGKLESGEITPAQYLQELGELEFPSLHALREEARVWMCPRCMEKVPEKLGACWKCNSVRPEIDSTTATDAFESPELPTAVTRPMHPWEGF
jgi:hypothetical protein